MTENLPPSPTNFPGNEPQNSPDHPRMVRVKQNLVRPLVMYLILGLTILVYVFQYLTDMGIAQGPFVALGQWLMGADLFDYLVSELGSDLPLVIGAKITPLILLGQLWRLITPVLLHASPAHILFNMYALYSIGAALESQYGHLRFLALYLLGALGGNVLSFCLSNSISVGASTAIFGLVAAQGVFIYQNRALFGPRAGNMLKNILFIIVVNLMLGLSGGIDNWGHLGGLLAGAAFSWFSGPRLSVDFNQVEPEIFDQRSQVTIWLSAIVVAFLLAALTLFRFLRD